MVNLKLPAAALLLGMLVVGCGSFLDTADQEDLVVAEVHLQQGFERHWVSVGVDGDVRFQAYLDSSVPYAGPLSTFTLDLPRGSHHLVIRWVPKNGNRAAHMQSTVITLEPGEVYYLGFTVSDDHMEVVIQDDPFPYV